jgi:hypothetical protein
MKVILSGLLIVLSACAEPSPLPLPQPLMIDGTLMVDHRIIVPPGGIEFANGSKIGGAQ